jgi:hypothetical protein
MSEPRAQKLGVIAACTAMAVGAFEHDIRQPTLGQLQRPSGFRRVGTGLRAECGEADRAARFVSIGGGRSGFSLRTACGLWIPDQRSLWLTFADADALRIEGDSPPAASRFSADRRMALAIRTAHESPIGTSVPASLAGNRRARDRSRQRLEVRL